MHRLYCCFLGLALIAGPAATAPYAPPRTTFGAPDLQGIWTNTALTMLERPPMFKALIATDAEAKTFETMFTKMLGNVDKPVAPDTPAPPVGDKVENSEWVEMSLHLGRIGGQMRSSWIVDPPDGKLPYTDAGKKANAAADEENFDNPEGRPLAERCLIGIGTPDGPPMMNTGYNGHYQIVQTRDYVAIEIEMIHEVRIIRMLDRQHGPAAIKPWLGDSVGWYEGDTLVVETTHFNPKIHIDSFMSDGFTYSPQARLIERFTRTGPNAMLYRFEVDDPVNFTHAWRGEMPWRTDKGPIYEYACHEGNYSLPLALSGARAQEARARLKAK